MAARLLHIFHGFAVGDALGNQYGQDRENLVLDNRGHLIIRPRESIAPERRVPHFRHGQVSDNTEMIIALLDSLRQNAGTLAYNKNMAALSYMNWATTRCPFMGRNIWNHFVGISSIGDFHARQDHLSPERATTLSNDALTRCVPLVQLGFQKDPELFTIHALNNMDAMMTAVAEDCALTNPADECIVANQCYIRMLHALIRNVKPAGAPLQTRRKRLKLITQAFRSSDQQRGMELFPNLQMAFQEAVHLCPRDMCNCASFYAHAIYCAIYCVLNFDTMTSAFDWVILRPGCFDANKNVAITGATMAAFLGSARCKSDVYDRVYRANFGRVMDICCELPAPNGFIPRPILYNPLVLTGHLNVI